MASGGLDRLLAIAEDESLHAEFRLVGVTWDARDCLDLFFETHPWNDDQWTPLRVQYREFHDHRLAVGDCFPRLETEHPLLWPFVEPEFDVYFHGVPRDPDTAEARLVEAHHRLSEGWLEFRRNAGGQLSGGFGLLAGGPKTLVDAYASVLHAEGVDTNLLGGRRRLEDPSDVRVLIVDEERRLYVVASHFE